MVPSVLESLYGSTERKSIIIESAIVKRVISKAAYLALDQPSHVPNTKQYLRVILVDVLRGGIIPNV